MIHLVFNEPDTHVLQQAIELDESLTGEIVCIKDDFAVGPLQNIYIGDGIEARKKWWNEILTGGDFELKLNDSESDDYQTVAQLVGTMRRDTEQTIWIWAAQNKHDVSGYYWLSKYMKEFQGRVFILYLNNLPFFNEKGQIFYPNWLHEIPAKEFLKAKKLAREITPSEFEVDPDEWKKLCIENDGVRFLEGGKKIVGKDFNFYDAEILSNITAETQKLPRVLSNTLNRMKIKTGDVFIVWRISEMAVDLKVELTGEWRKGWKEIAVKLL